MYNIKYTTHGIVCHYPMTEWNKLSNKAQEKVKNMCQNIKARLIVR